MTKNAARSLPYGVCHTEFAIRSLPYLVYYTEYILYIFHDRVMFQTKLISKSGKSNVPLLTNEQTLTKGHLLRADQ